MSVEYAYGWGASVYDATKSSKNRQTPRQFIASEDDLLKDFNRRRLQATTHDVQRNFAVAAWAIRRHLDFVASHYFICQTEDDGFNKEFEAFVKEKGKKENFHAAGRHNIFDAMRIVEASRTLDGDIFVLKLNTGQVQFIEADRVQNPGTEKRRPEEIDRWKNGILLDKFGRTRRVAVWRRSGTMGQYTYERMLRAQNVWQVGYYNRFDQYRGVSPMSSGLNDFRDLYENKVYALAKAKIAQMFGMKITRGTNSTLPGAEWDGTGGDDPRGRYKIDFGQGNVFLDMLTGDDADFMENKTPPQEYQDFMLLTIAMALKSLDLPFNFYQENFTNFFGSKAAFILYNKSTTPKQRSLQNWLYDWTWWQTQMGIAKGEFSLPSGVNDLSEIDFKWQAEGLPWWDLAREVSPTIDAIENNLMTLEQTIRERNNGEFSDWRSVVDQRFIEKAYIAEKERELGVTMPTAEIVGDENEEQDEVTDGD